MPHGYLARLCSLAAAAGAASFSTLRAPSAGAPWLLPRRAAAARRTPAALCGPRRPGPGLRRRLGRSSSAAAAVRAGSAAGAQAGGQPSARQLAELEALADEGEVEACGALFDELRSSSAEAFSHETASGKLWSVVLRAHAAAGDLTGAVAWHDRMRLAGASAGTDALRAVAEAAARAGQGEEAARWLLALRSAGSCAADGGAGEGSWAGNPTNCFDEDLAAGGIACVEASGSQAELGRLLTAAAAAGLSASELGLPALMGAQCRAGDVAGAERWLGEMKAAGMAPGHVCYSMLVDACTKAGDAQAASRWAGEMEQAAGAAMDARAYDEVISGCARAGDSDAAVQWLKTMEEAGVTPNPISYIAIVDVLARTGDSAGAAWWLSEMKRKGLQPPTATYAAVICSCAKDGHATAAVRWLTEMRQAGVPPCARCFNAIITSCAKSGDSRGAIRWLEEMTRENHAPDKFSYTEVVQSFAKKGDSKGARRWLDEMIQVGLSPDVVSYTAVVSACAKAGRALEAEEVMAAMQEEGLRPNAMTWTWAIIAYANSRASRRTFKGPEVAFRKMVASGLRPTNFTLSALDRAVGVGKRAALCEELGVAEGIVTTARPTKRQLHKPKKKWPRPHTLLADGGPEVRVLSAGQGAQMREFEEFPRPYGDETPPKWQGAW